MIVVSLRRPEIPRLGGLGRSEVSLPPPGTRPSYPANLSRLLSDLGAQHPPDQAIQRLIASIFRL